jgi:glutathione synthase
MRVCFLVRDVKAQKPGYGTVHLAWAAQRRGHDVRFVSVDDLSFLDDNSVLATTTRVRAGDYATPDAFHAALGSAEAVSELDALSGFDVVFLRANPLVDGARSPIIDLCWRLRLGGTLVVNDPEGLRRAGGRMYLADLPAEIRPRTLVSRSPERLKAFLRELDGPAVLKPLSPAGEERVFFLRRRQVKNLNQMIATVTEAGLAVAQEYLQAAELGAKRLLLVGGEPVQAGGHVAIYRLPARQEGLVDDTPGDGASTSRRRCDFSRADARICDLLRPKLLADGLYFVTVDVVGDKILKLEVFTPGGLHSARSLYGIDVGDIVIGDLERRVRVRAAYRTTFDPEAADMV